MVSRNKRRNKFQKAAGKQRRQKFKLTPIIEEEKFEWEKAAEAGIIFWCMACNEMVAPEKDGKRPLVCPKCQEKKIVFGTRQSVQNYAQRKKDLFSR